MATSKASLSSSGRPWTQTLQSDVQVIKWNDSHQVLDFVIAIIDLTYSILLCYSGKVSRVCGGQPKLPHITAHLAGKVPGQRHSCLRCCHVQELHQKKLANCEFLCVTRLLVRN